MFLEAATGALNEPLTGRRWSADDVLLRLAARAALFAARGLGPGMRVFIHYGNNLEFFVDLLAIWRRGACAIPIDARLTGFEIETLAKAARPDFALVDESVSAQIRGLMETLGARMIEAGERAEPAGQEALLRLDEPALILFTSGTTGAPKGVVHTHRSLRARWIALSEALGTLAYGRTLCLLPTHFGHGLICNALFPWLSGNDLYILPPFRAETVSQLGALIDEHEITAMSSVPTVWTLAIRLARPPAKGTLRRIHVGSAPLGAAQWSTIQNWGRTREVFNTYGITETASWVAGTNQAGFRPEDGLIGRPWGATMKILDPADATGLGKPLARGESGMIWVNTPALMAGYFEREALTAEVVREGWFKTGDIGLLDRQGHLYLRGRERDEINKGGMKVYPSDIDTVALQCPGIADACAFAVPDRLYGQNVGLAIVVSGAAPETLKALDALIAERLAPHQRPVAVHVLAEIPRTSRGKINRDQIAQACAKLVPNA